MKKLLQSFKNNPDAVTYMEACALIVFDEEGSRSVKTMTESDILALVAEKKGFVYHGDHRRQAISELHALFKKNEMFFSLRTIVSVVPSEENFKEHLYTLGLATNLLCEVRQKVTWADRLKQQHAIYVEEVLLNLFFSN